MPDIANSALFNSACTTEQPPATVALTYGPVQAYVLAVPEASSQPAITFEEAYFILSGEVEGTLDGKFYRARAGDVLWTSVGCVHTFVNNSTEPVRWLETFSPQPPKENVFRFVAEWETKARELEGTS